MNTLPQQLIASANPHHLATVTQVAGNIAGPAAVTQHIQFGTYILAARQDNQVGIGQWLTWANIAEIHLGVLAQHVEVGVVTDTGQHRHLDPKPDIPGVELLLNLDGILCCRSQIG